jgi:hypothetical protein
MAVGDKKESTPVNSKGFALIELFTSEGCSSCPPAEEVMHRLLQKANGESLPVYVLEFHVDYWDYLGWKDTFAMHNYSTRQQDYGDYLRLNSIYTPQAIINGKYEMVGSEEDKINAAVSKELQSQGNVIIESKAYKAGDSMIEVEYSITGAFSGCDLNIAVVESDLTTHVKKGENTGKILTHDNVVRIFKSIHLNAASGKIVLDAPHVDLSKAKLICYVQNSGNKVIVGATQAGIVK